MTVLKLDIWSDIACPWCYIGRRRLQAGIEQLREAQPDVEIDITYRSFQLTPDMPVEFEGSELDFLVKNKGMPEAQVAEMLDHVTRIAHSEGLDYDFDALVPTNTGQALELLHFATDHGKQAELKERLFAAHFIEGRHVGQVETLAELAAEVGLDQAEAVEALRSGRYRSDVNADIAQAAQLGISGVPFVVIDSRYGVSGAQSADTFANALTQALTDRQEVAP